MTAVMVFKTFLKSKVRLMCATGLVKVFHEDVTPSLQVSSVLSSLGAELENIALVDH